MEHRTDIILECRNISKSYRDHIVLKDIHLNVKNGEFLTLLGPSGCGKTTLLNMLSGFTAPNAGDIFLAGHRITHMPPNKRQINTVFQSYALFPHMTVFDNVAFGLRCKNIHPDDIHEQVMHMLRMVQLENLVHRKPYQMSGGQQQRVAIARAVINKPLVLLLDEPLSSLDYRLRQDMQLELKQFQKNLGITFVFVTHDQEEALSISDRVAIMHEGSIEQIGTPRQVYEEPLTLQVGRFIGQANIFETHVLSVLQEGWMTVELEGIVFKIKNKKDYQINDRIHLLIRPEDLQVWSKNEVDQTQDMLPAVVEQVIYKGVTVDLILRLPSQHRMMATQFFNQEDDKLDFWRGESVWVQWYAGWEVVLDHDDTSNTSN